MLYPRKTKKSALCFTWLLLFIGISLSACQDQKPISGNGLEHYTIIDSINTVKDVQILIDSIGGKSFKASRIQDLQFYHHGGEDCVNIADSLGIDQSFYKTDFDQNGFLDLLVIGMGQQFGVIAVMSYPNDSLELHSLTKNGAFQDCVFPMVTDQGYINLYYQQYHPDNSEQLGLSNVKLIYQYGGFIEYNAKPTGYSIRKIEFRTDYCAELCPVFSLSLEKETKSMFRAVAYNFKDEDDSTVFQMLLPAEIWEEYSNLLNYMDFPSLQDSYSVDWTDDQEGLLTIYYGENKIKTISDYGLQGTYGLKLLYDRLFNLREHHNWIKEYE